MKRFADIIEIIKLAIKSELPVQSANQEVLQEDTILNKSVLFVQIAIEILLAEKEVLTDVDCLLGYEPLPADLFLCTAVAAVVNGTQY